MVFTNYKITDLSFITDNQIDVVCTEQYTQIKDMIYLFLTDSI